MSKIYLEQVFEIRFKPQSKFLDKRGEIAGAVTDPFLNQWSITENTINFKSDTKKYVGGFFSFKNLGFSGSYPTNNDDFSSFTKNFIKKSWSYIPLADVIRIGLKTKMVTPVSSFNEYFDKFRDKFIALNKNELDNFGGTLVDLAFPLNFADGLNQFNTLSGPVKKAELISSFKTAESEAPENGIFCEVDYFTTEIRSFLKQKDVLDFVDAGIEKANKVSDEVLLILDK